MRRIKVSTVRASLVSILSIMALVLTSGPARASDIDVAGVLLIGSGVDTGDAPNNPYQLQLGGAGELTINGLVLGVRGTRSVGSDRACGVPCANVNDLRSIGGDVGFDWQFALLHVSPRLGIGRLKERDGSIVSAYLEPGGVAELEIAILTLGAEVRYRVALGEPDVSGLLAYLRLGLRF
jgi:hypothetical protein